MKHKKYRYLNDTPGDTGGTDTSAEIADPTPSLAPEPAPVVEAPASAPAAEADPFTKLGDLLDNVGNGDAPKPAAAPAAPAPAPKADGLPVDPKADDLAEPEGITERAKGRWAELADRARQLPVLQERINQTETQLNSVRDLVRGSNLDQAEFQNVLEMGRLYKSSSPADMQRALDQIEGLRADLAIRLGKDVQGVDVLSNHPDLKADVEGMLMPRERAMEIVRLRNAEAQMNRHNAATREDQQFHQTIQQASQRMDMALSQRANTPGHADKMQGIKGYFSDPARLNSFVTTYRPEQWESAVLMMYDAFQAPQAARSIPSVQPLRPGVTASGNRATGGAPRSAEDAIESAFARHGL
jgi:hypothetical protein